VTFLTEHEANVLLTACDRTTWTGRRDHAMLALAIQTGLRISELTALTISDLTLGTGAHVHTIGKGRKERRTPLLALTVSIVKAWLAECAGVAAQPLFPTITGKALSRDAVEHRIAFYVTTARRSCPSLRTKKITVHTLRHTSAMRLLLSGVDVTVIALWLGHEQVSTTNIYLHADMTQKERAIARVTPKVTKPGRYLAPDSVMAFLDTL